MSKKKRAIIELPFFLVVIVLLFWHVATWHYAGKYEEMLSGQAYLAALYFIGIMVVLSLALSYTTERITVLLKREKPTQENNTENES